MVLIVLLKKDIVIILIQILQIRTRKLRAMKEFIQGCPETVLYCKN